jgi:two-component sensor histidine kinase
LWLLYGLEPNSCEPTFDVWLQAIHPDDRDRVARVVQEASSNGVELNAEWRVFLKDGNERWLMSRGKPFRDESGQVKRYAGVVIDITKRKQAEEALQASLAEKVILLKEIHHRVKNNLNSIIDLISLQENTLSDPVTIAEFTELSGRIRSMALVHQLLYQSKSLSHIDLHSYFESLVSRLNSSYHPRFPIDLSVVAQEVEMDIDDAIPCGLIVTELVTNAFKYAFPHGRPHQGEEVCRIAVSAAWDGKAYTLTVSDNGVGLPAGLDWKESKSLGLQLVTLVGEQQLKGKVEVLQDGGTTFHLRFSPREV